MNRAVLMLLTVLCVAASIVMYMVGTNSSHLSELADFWYVPLPLAAVFLVLAGRNKKAD